MPGIAQFPLFSQAAPSTRTALPGAEASAASPYPGQATDLSDAAPFAASELFASLLQKQLAPMAELPAASTTARQLASGNQHPDGLNDLLANLIQADHSTRLDAASSLAANADELPDGISLDPWLAASLPALTAAPSLTANTAAQTDIAADSSAGLEQPAIQLQLDLPSPSSPPTTQASRLAGAEPAPEASPPETPADALFPQAQADEPAAQTTSATASAAGPAASDISEQAASAADPQTLAALLAYYPAAAQTASTATPNSVRSTDAASMPQGKSAPREFEPSWRSHVATAASTTPTANRTSAENLAPAAENLVDDPASHPTNNPTSHPTAATASFAAAAGFAGTLTSKAAQATPTERSHTYSAARQTANPDVLPAVTPELYPTAGTASKLADSPTLATSKNYTALPADETAAPLPSPADSETTLTGHGTQAGDFARLLASHPTAAATAPPPQTGPAAGSQPVLPVATPLHSPHWPHEVKDKLVWMVNRQEQRAELVLNPPQLGRIEVSLNITQEQTHAHFVAANPEARAALENALPRLREMFAEAGLSLGQAQVGAESQQQSGQMFENPRNRVDSGRYSLTANQHTEDNMPRTLTNDHRTQQGRGLVDVFA